MNLEFQRIPERPSRSVRAVGANSDQYRMVESRLRAAEQRLEAEEADWQKQCGMHESRKETLLSLIGDLTRRLGVLKGE
ncbi:MAG: hypothetical protein ABSH35_33095 [Isosphaeraceae bacterium]